MGRESSRGISRRELLSGAGRVLAATAIGGLPSLAGASDIRRRRSRRETVAVFGGGIAGLTVAHELAERGFEVTVYERRAWGGKARSFGVPNTAAGSRKPLPGEHGWRVFFGFYQHTVETMRRIPFGSNPNGVFDNLVPAPQQCFARDGGREDLVLPLGALDPTPYTADQVIDLLVGLIAQTRLPADAVEHFAQRMLVYLSSCDARRLGQWESVSWSDFIGARRFTDDYEKILAIPFAEFTQASRTERTSAQYGGDVVQAFVYNSMNRYSNGPLFRILNGPTNEAWIDPWVELIGDLGAKLVLGHELTGWRLAGDRIVGATIEGPEGNSLVDADWYVCALPVERARALWSEPVLAADPHLRRMRALSTGWMTGIQYYLRETLTFNRGHVYALDSPWIVETINQAQFWPVDFAATYGGGEVRDCLSAILARWTAPGVLYGKAAFDCTPDEVASEVWEQMKRHVNDTAGESRTLTDDMLVGWRLDPGVRHENGVWHNDDPLVLPAVGEHADRPDVTTAIPNLFLAGDYLKSEWEVANMDTASHNARRAVNAILERSGSSADPAVALPYPRPPEWEPLKRIDELRWRARQPNLFDVDLPLSALTRLLGAASQSTHGLGLSGS